MRITRRIPTAALAALLALACACAPRVAPPPAEPVAMPPVRFESDPDGVLPGDFYDALELFDRAGKAFDAGDYASARALYRRVIETFPDSDLVPSAKFNEALAVERSGDARWAIILYEALLAAHADQIDRTDVLFRIGDCLESLGEWEHAVDLFGRRVPAARPVPLRAAEAICRKGLALHRLGRDDEAIGTLRRGLADLSALRKGRLLIGAEVIGEGYFTLGEIYGARFDAVSLAVPDSEMEAALTTKSELLLLARAQYVKAIRSYSRYWMSAALCRVGQGYERYRDAILSAPFPAGLTPSETREYKRKLEDKTAPILRKALAAHRRNLKLARELGIDNEWVRTSRRDLARLSEM